MKNIKLVFWLLLLLVSNKAFSQDAEDCKDPAMFPNRMTNFLITECKTNFDAVGFYQLPRTGLS